jgi:hypothetical protein
MRGEPFKRRFAVRLRRMHLAAGALGTPTGRV